MKVDRKTSKHVGRYLSLVVNLLCVIIVSCTNLQATAKSTPHSIDIPTLATIIPTITSMPIVYPNKFSILSDKRIRFDNWHISFSLPKEWDIDKNQLGFQANPYVELYLFYGLDYPNDNGGTSIPELSFNFRPLPNVSDINNFLTTIKNWTDDNQFKIEKYYSLKEMEIDLDQAVGYKCAFTNGVKYECYVLRAVYKKEIIEVHLTAVTNKTQPFEKQFLEIIRSISLEK